MGLGRNLRRARDLKFQAWADLATAVAELAVARVRLAVQGAEQIIGSDAGSGRPRSAGECDHDQAIDRVAFAIPRMGARVPWHATCLVQAIAARNWLSRKGVRSSIRLGARKHEGEAIDAHAWLEAEGRLVVGGEVTGYTPFTPSRPD